MSRSKKLIILAAVLVVLAGAAVLALHFSAEEAEEETASVSVCAVDADSLTALSWTVNGETVSLTRTDDTWSVADEPDFPLDTDKIDTVVSAFAAVDASRAIEAPEDLAEYGLGEDAEQEASTADISFTNADGTVTLRFGTTSGVSGEQYCSDGDGNVYLVATTYADAFNMGLTDLIVAESIPAMSQVTELTVQTADNTLDICYLPDEGLAYSDSYVWFLQTGSGYETLDTELTESFIENITGLAWQSCVAWDADDAALAEYGLDEPDGIITVTYTGTSAEDGETELTGTFTLELGGGCYARIEGSNMVYTIDSTVYDTLLYTTSNDLLPDEVLALDADSIGSVSVTLDGETYDFEKITREVEQTTDEAGLTEDEAAALEETEEAADTEADTETEAAEPEYETVWTLNGEDAAFGTVLSTLTDMASTGSADGITADGSEEITFVIHTGTADTADTASDEASGEASAETAGDITLTICQYNSTSCLVTLNGVSTVFISREDAVNLVESVNALVL